MAKDYFLCLFSVGSDAPNCLLFWQGPTQNLKAVSHLGSPSPASPSSTGSAALELGSITAARCIQRGFDESRKWDWRLFEDRQEAESKLLLYKLHGSIDWTYDGEKNLTYVDGFSHITPDDIAIIFGTTYKLQYVDPFLFFAYELRRYTLDFAKLIVTVGYGFADQHINGILSQSLNRDTKRMLLSVTLIEGEDDEDRQRKEKERLQWIRQQLNLRPESQVSVHNMGGKDFLSQGFTLRLLGELFPTEDENLFEVIGQQPKSATPPEGCSPSVTPVLVPCTIPALVASPNPPSADQDTLQEKEQPKEKARRTRGKKVRP